jgi:hypothetical protein
VYCIGGQNSDQCHESKRFSDSTWEFVELFSINNIHKGVKNYVRDKASKGREKLSREEKSKGIGGWITSS